MSGWRSTSWSVETCKFTREDRTECTEAAGGRTSERTGVTRIKLFVLTSCPAISICIGHAALAIVAYIRRVESHRNENSKRLARVSRLSRLSRSIKLSWKRIFSLVISHPHEAARGSNITDRICARSNVRQMEDTAETTYNNNNNNNKASQQEGRATYSTVTTARSYRHDFSCMQI